MTQKFREFNDMAIVCVTCDSESKANKPFVDGGFQANTEAI